MYLFYCDETNLEPSQGDFFVYGGIAIPSDNAMELHNKIEKARNDAGFKQDDLFKFNPCPDDVKYDDFVKAKETVIKAATKCDCVLIISIISHKIGYNTESARRNEINRVVYHFNCFLNRPKTHGLVLIDRFSDSQIDKHLREKFSVGITGLPFSPVMKLENIVGFHYSAIGQSHFPSLVDIILGSFRFAINAHTKGKEKDLRTAKFLLQLIEPLFYREGHKGSIHQISLNFSPNVIKVKKYREQYEALKSFLEESGIDTDQTITDVPKY